MDYKLSRQALGAAYACFKSKKADAIADFDFSFNKSELGYLVFSGLDKLIEEIPRFFQSIPMFGDTEFRNYLLRLCFSGDIYSVCDQSIVFAREPVLILRAPCIEGILLADFIKQIIVSHSASQTRRSRLEYAVGGKGVYTEESFNIMPYTFIGMHECEYSAFSSYLKVYPNAVLPLDAYDTLASGLPAAIEAIRDFGDRYNALLLGSGEFIHLAKKTRRELDACELSSCKIAVRVSDEHISETLAKSGAPIDFFIAQSGEVKLDGSMDLCALEANGVVFDKIKLTESYSKVTLPGKKKLVRFYSHDGVPLADEIMLENEPLPSGRHTIFHPEETHKTKTLRDYTLRELLVPVFKNGRLVYSDENKYEPENFPSDYMRLKHPEGYPVDYSEELWTQKRRMTGRHRSTFFLR